jgi:hypothetical protein
MLRDWKQAGTATVSMPGKPMHDYVVPGDWRMSTDEVAWADRALDYVLGYRPKK